MDLSNTGYQAVTPEDQAVRREFAEITGEDPRSYERAVEYHQTRTTSPLLGGTGRPVLSTLIERLSKDNR